MNGCEIVFPQADRQWRVFIRPFLQLDRNELMAGHAGHRLHDAVGQPILTDFLDTEARVARDDHHHRLSASHMVQLIRL
jgi:hypothetical protein